jgi:hypothetical protein
VKVEGLLVLIVDDGGVAGLWSYIKDVRSESKGENKPIARVK